MRSGSDESVAMPARTASAATASAPRPPATTGSARARWATRGYAVFFACYLAGLLLWLLLGLLPSVVFAVPALTRELASLAAGHGPLAGFASTVVSNRSMMPSGSTVAVEYLFSLLNLALGVLITVRRPHGAVPRLLALACIGTAATFNEPSHVVFHLLEHAPLVTAVHFMFHVVSGVAYLWAVVLFPDDRLPLADSVRRRWVPWTAVVVVTAAITFVCYRSSFVSHPPFFVAFFGILVSVVGIAAQTVRVSAVSAPPVVRQQAGLLRAALAPALVVAVLWLGAHAVEALGGPPDAAGSFADGVQSAFPAVFAVVPVMLFVSIVRYRLWDIDVVVSRTLVYALLAGTVVVAYAAALAVSATLLGTGVWSTLAAFVVVALLAEPARQRCQRVANRLVFGTTLTPRETMRALADRLSASSPADELAELAHLMVAATRCTAASVWLLSGESLVLAAVAPSADRPARDAVAVASPSYDACVQALPGWTCTPITHEGRLLAVLAVQTPPRVTLPLAEAALARDLAGHAGLLVMNARLATELALEVGRVSAAAAELRRSRQEVVAASDAERRRLERNIHDGAQQELVATLITLRTLARRITPAEPAPSKPGEVDALRTMVAAARETIEELCRGDAPKVLADRGLAVALDAAAATARRTGLTVEIDCDLDGRLPDDVEVALYFACLEALQNSAKHAHAQRVIVRVERAPSEATLSVRDDGVGFDPARGVAGSGLKNLLQRMAAVGGAAVVESSPGAGTTTRCRVPT